MICYFPHNEISRQISPMINNLLTILNTTLRQVKNLLTLFIMLVCKEYACASLRERTAVTVQRCTSTGGIWIYELSGVHCCSGSIDIASLENLYLAMYIEQYWGAYSRSAAELTRGPWGFGWQQRGVGGTGTEISPGRTGCNPFRRVQFCDCRIGNIRIHVLTYLVPKWIWCYEIV